MSNGVLKAHNFSDQLPNQLKPHFLIMCPDMPPDILPVAIAFGQAGHSILPAIRQFQTWYVLFLPNVPFTVQVHGQQLQVQPHEGDINICIDHMIFINCAKTLELVEPIRVAVVLEELVHVCLNVKDEVLVKKIVCELYDQVKLVDGKYAAK